MIKYTIQRLVLLLPVLLVVGILVFSLVHLAPGDPASVMLGSDATREDIAELRRELGLEDPFYVQFAVWFGDLLRLDLGDSFFLDRPVSEALMDRAQPTVLLTLYSLTLTILIGVPAGIISAIKRNSLIDRIVMMVAVSGVAIPPFVLGILLILVFAVSFGWLSAGGYTDIRVDPVEHFKQMIMPAFSLGFSAAALLARLVRSAMLETLGEDYVRTARAKGIAHRHVIIRHALRNALIPTVTIIGYTLGTLLGGAVVTETVFVIPGMGRLVVQSVLRRDFPVIQGAVMTIAVFYVLANLLVDILYIYIDPRIRYGE